MRVKTLLHAGEPVVGQLVLLPKITSYLERFAYSESYLPAEGQLLPIRDYVPLYSVIENHFGGDSNTFALPDLRDKSPISNYRYYIAVKGDFPTTV